MTTRHGDPACGTEGCFACRMEHRDGRPRRWREAGAWFDGHDTYGPADDDPTAFTIALETALAEEVAHDPYL